MTDKANLENTKAQNLYTVPIKLASALNHHIRIIRVQSRVLITGIRNKSGKSVPVTTFMKLSVDFGFHLLHCHASGRGRAKTPQNLSGIVFLRFGLDSKSSRAPTFPLLATKLGHRIVKARMGV